MSITSVVVELGLLLLVAGMHIFDIFDFDNESDSRSLVSKLVQATLFRICGRPIQSAFRKGGILTFPGGFPIKIISRDPTASAHTPYVRLWIHRRPAATECLSRVPVTPFPHFLGPVSLNAY